MATQSTWAYSQRRTPEEWEWHFMGSRAQVAPPARVADCRHGVADVSSTASASRAIASASADDVRNLVSEIIAKNRDERYTEVRLFLDCQMDKYMRLPNGTKLTVSAGHELRHKGETYLKVRYEDIWYYLKEANTIKSAAARQAKNQDPQFDQVRLWEGEPKRSPSVWVKNGTHLTAVEEFQFEGDAWIKVQHEGKLY